MIPRVRMMALGVFGTEFEAAANGYSNRQK